MSDMLQLVVDIHKGLLVASHLEVPNLYDKLKLVGPE